MKLEQEQRYEIALSEDDELMISIRQREGEPEESAVLLYDNGEHALFYRNSELTIVLDYIHPQVRELLAKADHVVIAEVDDKKEIKNAYEVSVKMVKKLPLSKEDLITLPEGQEPEYPEPEEGS